MLLHINLLVTLILLPSGGHSLTSSNTSFLNNYGAKTRNSMIQRYATSHHTETTTSPNTTHTIGRRSFVTAGTAATATLLGLIASPRASSAAIDVSGLGSGAASSRSPLADQLKAYDGSASARVREITSSSPTAATTTTSPAIRASVDNNKEEIPDTVATNAFVAGTDARLTKVGLAKQTTRYDGQLLAPTKSESVGSRYLSVNFEFPTDWLQLDKFNGGIQYVDQRNGDKLYVLQATLPQDATLSTVPKAWFGQSIFDPKGTIAKSGNTVEEYKVASAKMLEDCGSTSLCYNRRRLKIKYSTVTGNNLQVERRALVDAYEVDGDVYMLMTSSNANKFEAQGAERDTVEAIVSSFRIDR